MAEHARFGSSPYLFGPETPGRTKSKRENRGKPNARTLNQPECPTSWIRRTRDGVKRQTNTKASTVSGVWLGDCSKMLAPKSKAIKMPCATMKCRRRILPVHENKLFIFICLTKRLISQSEVSNRIVSGLENKYVLEVIGLCRSCTSSKSKIWSHRGSIGVQDRSWR